MMTGPTKSLQLTMTSFQILFLTNDEEYFDESKFFIIRELSRVRIFCSRQFNSMLHERLLIVQRSRAGILGMDKP